MTGLLNGRTVIVTGAGRGLGRAYAEQCADAGATVVVNDLDPTTAAATVDTILASGGVAVACVGATNDPGFGEELVRAAIEAGGTVDGIVANAGIISPRSIFDETFENAARQIDVNVMGVIEPVMAVAKAMRARSTPGSIVLITSGARCGVPGMPTYGASKGAVASLCWGWALECEPFGIRVNALSPVARTEMFPQPGDTTSDPFPPERIAPAVLYLLSDLSTSITGQILRFTGDLLGLHPAPIGMSASATRLAGWTAEEIAAAMDRELAAGVADVGLGPQLAVPLTRS